WNVPEPALSEVMTGRDGAVRDFSVPPGQVQPELIKRQNTIAEALFCPPFLALWRASRSPSFYPSSIFLCRVSAKAGSRWSGTRPSFRGYTRGRARRTRSPTPARWAQRQDVTSWSSSFEAAWRAIEYFTFSEAHFLLQLRATAIFSAHHGA